MSAVAAVAQLEVGDDVKLNLTGNLGYGYSDTFGNYSTSSHAQGFSGDADLTGYYFHPNFLSFSFRPYVMRNQSSADSQNITRSTGFGSEVDFFGGSHFPGSISFGKDFSTNSQIQVAGLSSIIGDSSSRNFGVSWSELLPNYPHLTASFTDSSFGSSVDGINQDSNSSTRGILLNSTYSIAGFTLQGAVNRLTNHYDTSSLLLPVPTVGGGSSTTYSVNAQHSLPLNGSVGLGWGHSSYDSDNGGNWSTNYYNESLIVVPTQRLSLSQTLNYTTNLSAALLQSTGAAGSAQLLSFGSDSNSLYLNHTATFRVFKGLSVNGHFSHREQDLLGQHYADSQFGGTVNYNFNHPLFGFLYFGFGLVDTASKEGNDGLGVVANVGMNRKFGKWDTSADFNYQQDVQTLIGVATTSSYSYGGNIRRRINRETFISFSGRDSHSGFVTVEGNGNRAESFGGSVGWRRYSLSGSYSQSAGTAVLNANGILTPVPNSPLITPDFLLFNGRSYAISGSTVLLRRITVAASYSNFRSETTQNALSSLNHGQQYNARMEYKLRKFSIVGGFGRTDQDLSALTGPPRVVNSFYVSLTRWFNVF